MTYQGQPIIYRTSSTGFHYGFIAGNITNGGATADILVHENGNTWEDTGNDPITTAIGHAAVDTGSSVGQWLPNNNLITTALSASPTFANNSRTLGSTFQPSASRPVLVVFSVRIVSTITLSGGQAGRIELKSDSSSPPTTVRCRFAGGATGTAVAGLSLNDTAEGILMWLAAPGDNVRLDTVNETGTPTYSIVNQYEITL